MLDFWVYFSSKWHTNAKIWSVKWHYKVYNTSVLMSFPDILGARLQIFTYVALHLFHLNSLGGLWWWVYFCCMIADKKRCIWFIEIFVILRFCSKPHCHGVCKFTEFGGCINVGVCFLNGFSFIKAKSDIAPEDVQALMTFGFEIFHAAQNKFVVQVIN